MTEKTQAPAVVYLTEGTSSHYARPFPSAGAQTRYIRADIAEGLLGALEGLFRYYRPQEGMHLAAQQAIRAAKEAGL